MVTSLAFSQRQKKDRPQPNPELKKEMQSYIEKNVVPVLQKSQDEFDAQLSAEDLAFIQAKRTLMAQKRAERKAAHEANRPTEEERKAMKEKMKNMTDEERQAFRKEKMAKRKGKRGEGKEERKAMRAEMKKFMESNEALVKSTMTSLKPNYEKWTADQKAIMEKYRPADAPAMKEGKKDRIGLFGLAPHHRGKHHKKGKHGKREQQDGEKVKGAQKEKSAEGKARKRHGKKGGKLATQFILWDGTAPTPRAERRGDIDQQTITTPDANVLLGQNFPNPATGITRIELRVPEGVSRLNLTVTDLNGKMVKQQNLTNLNAGKNSVELNVSDLPNGQYFYTIEGDGIKETKKMNINQ